MNGKLAKKIRQALGYKKTPDQLVERGGIREKDGELKFFFARNAAANRYRWWKRGVVSKSLPLGLVNHLAHQQGSHPQSDQCDLSTGEESA